MTIDYDAEKAFSQYTFLEILDVLFKTSYQLNIPIAIWKLPESQSWEVMIGNITPIDSETLIEDLAEGFLVNGFENKGIEGSLFLKSVIRYNQQRALSIDDLKKLGGEFTKLFLMNLQSHVKVAHSKTIYSIEESSDAVGEKNYFKNITQKALVEIKEGKFQKVILSRILLRKR